MKTLIGVLVHLVLTISTSAQTTWFVDASNPACPGSGTQGEGVREQRQVPPSSCCWSSWSPAT